MCRYREKQAGLDEKRRQQQLEQEEKELDGCTFTPQTRDCPAYVKRIAKSMQIVKAARQADPNLNIAAKPDWR